mmetsp:Transcript_16981/g.24530  ORF Transcript_16981/g.24530 Transcript_16981/m.24530 type:complete len:85 (+) Transcript_16981:385-639(+)
MYQQKQKTFHLSIPRRTNGVHPRAKTGAEEQNSMPNSLGDIDGCSVFYLDAAFLMDRFQARWAQQIMLLKVVEGLPENSSKKMS